MNRWKGGAKRQDIIDDVRTQISDSAELYTDTFLTNVMNHGIRVLAKEEDLRRLFKYKLQTELATLNSDGKPAARWTLNIPGRYMGKERMNFVVQSDGCYRDITPCYKTPKEFFRCYKFPEYQCPGTPCSYTMENIGDTTTIIFDRPPAEVVALDAVIYIDPARLTLEDETIPLGDSFSNLITELMIIMINKEQTSYDQARMNLEDYDKEVVDAAQSLALQHMNDEPLFVAGGVD